MRMKSRISKIHTVKLGLLLLFLIFQVGSVKSENLRSLVNLKGYWKFSIGDDPQWANPNYNDSKWQKVFVPDSWETNGFHEYNGYAWYRKTFELNQSYNREFVYLRMGKIDDVDEVFVNGKLVGASGNFPPRMKTAYDIPRMYPVPVSLLREDGKNTIAVRVYDEILDGGIISGDIGLFLDLDQIKMDVDLSGYWNFEINKTVDKGNLNCVNYRKGKIFVPGFWETRGYNDYDGKAVYTKSFSYPSDLSRDDKVLVLGVIDDEDEVYLNGDKLRVLRAKQDRRSRYANSNYATFRAYEIPDGLLNRSNGNEIEVIVTDHMGPGGIYRGPIGITNRDRAEALLQREYKDNRSNVQKFFDYWFD